MAKISGSDADMTTFITSEGDYAMEGVVVGAETNVIGSDPTPTPTNQQPEGKEL